MTSATKDKPLSAQPRHGLLYFAAPIAPLSGLLFGYDTGVVSGALLFLKAQYRLSSTMQEVVTGVVLVGAVLGAAGSGRLAALSLLFCKSRLSRRGGAIIITLYVVFVAVRLLRL